MEPVDELAELLLRIKSYLCQYVVFLNKTLLHLLHLTQLNNVLTLSGALLRVLFVVYMNSPKSVICCVCELS